METKVDSKVDVKSNIKRLVDISAPYWAGEAEVVRTYWNSPLRSVQTDFLWMSRQCFKEFWGSGVGKFDRKGIFRGILGTLVDKTSEIDVTIDRHEVLELLEGVKAEFSHYVAFADAYDSIRPAGSPGINPEMLEEWPEEAALTRLRYRHQDEHGAIGMRACKWTEGGYCTLFSEGMALKGRDGIDGKIAAACAMVHEDEFGHMLNGIVNIAEEHLSDPDWGLLEKLVVEQLRQRILMRNAQFSQPVPERRLQEILRGEAKPIAFDYTKAGLAS
jgi:hypothetical protein